MARSGSKSRSSAPDKKDVPLTNPIEWGIAAVSAILLLALLGFLAYEVIARNGSGPVFQLSVEEVTQGPSSYAVIIDVFNAGHATAAAVEIEGTLTTAGESTVSHVVLDYAPAESGRRAVLLFEDDPRAGELELRVVGYTEP